MSRTHFVGIGGIGMSAVARVMLERGLWVSGSDSVDVPVLAELRSMGAEVHLGYDAKQVEGAGAVVVSTATRDTNPELAAARSEGTPVLHRSAALAQLLTGYRSVAVAGTHGKTTTTAMLVSALQAGGFDPSYAVGGELPGGAPHGHHGSGKLFVVEADESDGSFVAYRPFGAIVTNVEPDHLDHHGTTEAYEQAFVDFAMTVTDLLVACLDDAGAERLATAARAAGKRVVTYGAHPEADLQLVDLSGSRYDAVLGGESVGTVELRVAGEHLARNSAAALLMAVELGIPAAQAIQGLQAFTGVRRRMELKGSAAGVRVYDDYAHHPTEVTAQLRAARQVAGEGRVIVLFQPHLYSRTTDFAAGFGEALALADEVVVLDVYGAREDPVPGVTGALVADAVPLPADRVRFEPDREKAARTAATLARSGDLVLTLGAGDITELGTQILQLLERTS
ncbi:MAG: murC [Frankiales bacterium]|nr:murC [Frankiales bacterium]